ncbi:dihydroorotase [Raineyella fluvialis]|uniref:Dihydroorotase n=1 Tax=Raineyella fluvialis TaxID=2662261 RepID=A0A5Q2FBF4_9ACTN|nr:dihydroorotase [Raineyella fluvialis]QGF22373.1 amidohydrolase family protein [Raineyella fluvialis]
MTVTALSASVPAQLLITGVTLPDGSTADVYVDGPVFGDPSSAPADVARLDGSGLIALPGLVDPHVHLREPGREDAETIRTGTAAAARGGFTAVQAMANTSPVTDTAELACAMAATAAEHAACVVIPCGAITQRLAGEHLAELEPIHRAAGTMCFSDDGKCVADSQLMREAFEEVRAFDGVLAQHAQDPRLAGPDACCHEGELSARLGLPGWTTAAESAIVARDVELAALTGARYHVCHVSAQPTLDVIRAAKARGVRITAEATPHHLLLTTDLLADLDTTFKVNPPLRPAEHVEALRAAVADGTVDMIGTDHAPHAPQDKAKAFVAASPGMVGLEQSLAVVIDTLVRPGRLDWAGVADRMAHSPAALLGLTDQGRPVAPGEPANLCLVDPEARHAVDPTDTESRSRNNPYAGRDLPDPVRLTVCLGHVTYRR